jgi:hypothetical protein
MKKPAMFTTIALALCAADARAQSDANQLDDAPVTSSLARRIEQLAGQPGHDLSGEGHWMSASAVQKGRIEAVIEEEGEPRWYLDAFTTEYLPGVGPSQRYQYGGVYGTLYALDGTEAAPILVQGEWARHGQGSPYGSLMALVFRNGLFPEDVDVLGTLTGGIQFFEDGAGTDGGSSMAITGVQRLASASAVTGASGQRAQAAAGLARPQDPIGSAVAVRVLGSLGSAQRITAADASLVSGAITPRPTQGNGGNGASGDVAIQAGRTGQLAAAGAASSAPSDAGSPSRRDRFGTCGTESHVGLGSAPGAMIPAHDDVGTGGAGTMQIDGLVRLVYHVLD